MGVKIGRTIFWLLALGAFSALMKWAFVDNSGVKIDVGQGRVIKTYAPSHADARLNSLVEAAWDISIWNRSNKPVNLTKIEVEMRNTPYLISVNDVLQPGDRVVREWRFGPVVAGGPSPSVVIRAYDGKKVLNWEKWSLR